jgi:hypothetical protein
MPAMVGALLGSVGSTQEIPSTWRDRIERFCGYCVPSTRGTSLQDLAERLLNVRTSRL